LIVEFGVARCAIMIAVLALVLSGCAPSSTMTPDSMPPSGSALPMDTGGPRAGEGARGGARESQAPSGGSLRELQEGKSTATQPSSPLKDLYFDFDRYDLRADARETLRANATWLQNNASVRVEIEGHCDERGTSEYNLALGAKRAQSAKDYLVSLGISGERLSTISYGEEIPTCKEPNEQCWRQNRRARFVILASRPAS